MTNEVILSAIKERMRSASVLFSEDEIGNHKTVIGYDKTFKWQWMATQLNTFIVVADFGDESVSTASLNQLLLESFGYAKLNYSGWPRGVQSSVAVIAVTVSKNITNDAVMCCHELKSRKTWAGFSIPVAVDSTANNVHYFRKYPLRGIIYYPYYKKLISEMLCIFDTESSGTV